MSDTSSSSSNSSAAVAAARDDTHEPRPTKREGQGQPPERHDSRLQPDGPPTATRSAAYEERHTAEGAAAATQNSPPFAHNNAILPTIDATLAHPTTLVHRNQQPHHSRTASAGLHLQTNLNAPAINSIARSQEPPAIYETPVHTTLHPSLTSPTNNLLAMSSSLRSNISTASIGSSSLSPGSANSALPSPYLAAMTDLTPLPSPLVVSGESAAPWRRNSRATLGSSRHGSLDDSTPIAGRPSSLPGSPNSPSKRKKGYGSLVSAAVEASIASNANATQQNESTGKRQHSRNRSISDFVPEQLQNVRPRHVTFGSGDAPHVDDYQMQREAYLAAQRGLTVPTTNSAQALPSPPPSNTSVAESDDADDDADDMAEGGEGAEYLQIECGINKRKRKFREIRQLGQGTFSKVMLATRERIPSNSLPEDIEEKLDQTQLVAVKVIEHGPAGGADEERIGTSLKREVEMLKSISHPSLVHLKACEYQPTRTLLVLTYCPGGDLFELASSNRDVLTPGMVHRMFSELVSAVRYLHKNWIVHRDIKLENVLVNLRPADLRQLSDPVSCPVPLVTLTDLGLGRRMPDPPESPLLTTRCGSEDYAAPEILLGQPYDGRLTDAWALGVLLYALMEGRLPFDAPPGRPDRSRNSHRIARCAWIWCRFGDEDGEWDSSRGSDWAGARLCVEGLLKKVRMGRKSLEEVESMEWVQQGIQVPGGLQVPNLEEGDVS